MANFSMKLASTVSAAAIVATSMSASLVSASSSEFLAYAEALAKNNVIGTQATEAGYRLKDNITRAELAKVAANIGGFTKVTCTGEVYTDVKSTLGDLCEAIETLAANGVVSKKAVQFRAKANVTRAEATNMLLGATGQTPSEESAGFTDVTSSLGDLAGFINRAAQQGIVNKANRFRPNDSITRGEVFKIAAKVAGLKVDLPTTDANKDKAEQTAGNLSVSMAGSPVATYVPYNASSVKVGTVKLTATKGDVRVTSVVVTRSGLGDVKGIESLQLAHKGVAVTDARGMSTSSQTATLRFTSPFVVKAGTSVELDVLTSLVDGADSETRPYQNNHHNFEVTTVNTNNGAATGVPVKLGEIHTTSYRTGKVTVNSLSAGSLTTGKANQTFATVQLMAGRDATIKAFAVTRTSGPDLTNALANVKAFYNGKETGVVTVTSDKITVSDLNIDRQNGETATIELRADGTYIGTDASLDLAINSSADVSATEKSTGYIMRTEGANKTATINLSKIDLNIKAKTTASKTVAPGTSSVELFNADITSSTEFDISNYTIENKGNGDFSDFVDGKVTLYVGNIDNDISTGRVDFTRTSDRFTLEAGKPVNVRVVGTLKPTATANKTYSFALTLNKAKSTTSTNEMNVNRSLQGFTTTINTGSYSLQRLTTGGKTIQEGTNQKVLEFTMYASSEDQVLKTLTVNSTNGNFDTFATAVEIVNGEGQTIKSITDSTELAKAALEFTDLSETIKMGTSAKFAVNVSVKSGDVEQLGNNVKVTATATKVVRAVNQSETINAPATNTVEGTEYQVSNMAPTVKITNRDGAFTTVEFQNSTNYDVNVTSIKYKLTRNETNNGNYLAWEGTTKFLDAKNGTEAGNLDSNVVPGEVTVTPTNMLLQGAPITRVIELIDSKNTITEKSYGVEITEMKYKYVDRTDSSKMSKEITERVSTARASN